MALPGNEELFKVWCELGRNNCKTAERYGVGESAVRKRMRARQPPRVYKRLPVRGRALYAEWLKEGADRGASSRLAARYGVRAASIWMSMRRYLKSEGLY